MDEKRLEPREMMQVGDDIDVVILKIDRERERVSLGVKQLEPDPWLQVPQKYKVGTATQAHIVDIVDFGAFAKLEGGIEGLIHISELSDQHVNSPGEVVRVGDVIDVKVINIDLQDRRIGLSRKAYLAEGHRIDAEVSSAPKDSTGRQEPRRQDADERAQPTGRTLADLVDEAQARRDESDSGGADEAQEERGDNDSGGADEAQEDRGDNDSGGADETQEERGDNDSGDDSEE